MVLDDCYNQAIYRKAMVKCRILDLVVFDLGLWVFPGSSAKNLNRVFSRGLDKYHMVLEIFSFILNYVKKCATLEKLHVFAGLYLTILKANHLH
jgi:hypothetical protein